MRGRRLRDVAPLPCARAFALSLGAACSGGARAPVAPLDWPPPAAAPAPDDRGEICADLGDWRVCWGEGLTGPGCSDGACVRARPLPAGPRPAAGWRCSGRGAERVCEHRALGAGPFACDGARCLERYARLPDDGEWECADLGGAVICRGGVEPAGVVPGPPDRGWICGERREGAGAKTERVCVDFSPDFPGGAANGWRCRFLLERGVERECVRDQRAPEVGRACAADSDCPPYLGCRAGRCLPSLPRPTCWTDRDCPGACRLGTCSDASAAPL